MDLNKPNINSTSPIKRRRLKTTYTKKVSFSKEKNSKNIMKIVLYIIAFCCTIIFINSVLH